MYMHIELVELLTAVMQMCIQNILVLLKIGCILPVSSCEAERSFSGYRRVKSYIHSSMIAERLTGIPPKCTCMMTLNLMLT